MNEKFPSRALILSAMKKRKKFRENKAGLMYKDNIGQLISRFFFKKLVKLMNEKFPSRALILSAKEKLRKIS